MAYCGGRAEEHVALLVVRELARALPTLTGVRPHRPNQERKRPMPTTRRTFCQQLGTVSASAPLARFGLGPHRPGPAQQLHLAAVGVGGKGESDIAWTSKGHKVVALCDIDARRLDKAGEAYAGATRYADWRKMLEQKDIDAVTISTPDHMHAAIAMAAMDLGKHVYVQKPLTWSVFEARQLTAMAKRQGVVTQMGNQHRSNRHMKGARHLIHQGAIGAVREAHVWTDRPIWPQGMDRPAGQDPIPEHVSWDLWLGVAPQRPFKANTYHGFKWRGFWDFGTGALGDMGCHLMDPVVFALDLPAPTRVSAEGPDPHADTAPLWSVVTYDFPESRTERGVQPALTLKWYDGKKLPDAATLGLPKGRKCPTNGALFVGETGKLFVNHDSGPWLIRDDAFHDVLVTAVEADDHYQQWTNACLGEGQCVSDFATAGPLTETVLLGNLAYRAGKPIEWDAANLRCPNAPETAPWIRREERAGWQVAWI